MFLTFTVHCKLIHSMFRIFPPFNPEMCAGFTTYCSDFPHIFELDPVTEARTATYREN
jgi:hypothetical protein